MLVFVCHRSYRKNTPTTLCNPIVCVSMSWSVLHPPPVSCSRRHAFTIMSCCRLFTKPSETFLPRALVEDHAKSLWVHIETMSEVAIVYQARAKRGRPQGFLRIKKALRLKWGPKNVHFGRRHFWDLNINVRILIFLFKELPGVTFLCFEFSTRVPKNGPKNGPKFKKRRKITKTTSPLGGHSI